MPKQLATTDVRLNALVHLKAPLCILDVDEMCVLWANAAALKYWCADSETDLYQRDVSRGMSDTVLKRLRQIQTDCHDGNMSLTEFWTLFPSVQSRPTELALSAFPLDESSRLLLVEVVNATNGTSSETLHATTALMHTTTMISLYDRQYQLMYCNPAAREVLTHRCDILPDRLVNSSDLQTIQQALTQHDHCALELEVITKQGRRWHSMNIKRTINAVTGGESLLVSATDETERRRAQHEAYQLAYTDTLTKLPNRAAMKNHLDELLGTDKQTEIANRNSAADDLEKDEPSTTDPRFSLLFLDLDRFKAINDSLGHAAGDQLLVEVARRLQQAGGSNSMVARFGGDEFVMIINGITEASHLRDVANSIIESMSKPVVLAGQKLRVLPSIGIACYPENGVTVSELMQNADAAMYLAKANQSGFYFYDEKMTESLNESIKDRLQLENDLVAAVHNNEFELYYQPKISSRNLSIVGVEALIRWNHPTRGMVPPDHFITIAEETGQIIELGNWVLLAAMQQQKDWQSAGNSIPVSINISARQFKATDLVMHVSEALVSTGCDPAMIELEITESMLLGDTEMVHETLHQLSAMGITLALDDFGTGYSNLAYLQKYPLDTLKIDRVFLADQKRSMLMGTILGMGKVLGLTIVAEGVETQAQAEWLIANGCDQLQGYFFSKPLPVTEATAFIEHKRGVGKTSLLNKAA